MVVLPGRGKLFKQFHHPQYPLLMLYRPVPFIPRPCCYCRSRLQGGKVHAIFAVAGVWTNNDPPCLPILREGEGIVCVDDSVPTASLAILSSRRCGRPTHPHSLFGSFSTTRDSESLTLRPMSPPGFEAKHPILISSPLGQSPSMCRYAHRS